MVDWIREKRKSKNKSNRILLEHVPESIKVLVWSVLLYGTQLESKFMRKKIRPSEMRYHRCMLKIPRRAKMTN